MRSQFGTVAFTNSADAVVNRIVLHDGPLDLAWHHCSSTAEFLGVFFSLQRTQDQAQASSARHGISYLVNELLENAVKFRDRGGLVVESSLEGDRFEFKLTNFVRRDVAERFVEILEELTSSDPGELLIARIEENAADPNSSASGLGILTLMNDYGADLGWVFSEPAGGDTLRLETFAALTLD